MKHRIGKIIVISGCPRSGTSLMMDIHRKTYGDDMIMGNFDDVDKTEEELNKEMENHKQKILENIKHPGQRAMTQYMMGRNEDRFPKREENKEKRRERRKKAKDMNPNGFGEHAFSVQGIQCIMKNGRGQIIGQFQDELEESLKNPKILKVVSQGLMTSDPIYIGKIVYMLRHPRAVAKSQERLEREGGDIVIDGKKREVHTPEMFINVTMMALRFFKNNPGIPVKIVQHA